MTNSGRPPEYEAYAATPVGGRSLAGVDLEDRASRALRRAAESRGTDLASAVADAGVDPVLEKPLHRWLADPETHGGLRVLDLGRCAHLLGYRVEVVLVALDGSPGAVVGDPSPPARPRRAPARPGGPSETGAEQ